MADIFAKFMPSAFLFLISLLINKIWSFVKLGCRFIRQKRHGWFYFKRKGIAVSQKFVGKKRING